MSEPDPPVLCDECGDVAWYETDEVPPRRLCLACDIDEADDASEELAFWLSRS